MYFSATGMRYWPFQWLLALLFLVVWTQTASAQYGADVVRVEEDWELVVGTPAPGSLAPQVNSVISPRGNIDGLHAAFELNVQSLLEYAPGGLQLQLWFGQWALNDRKFPNSNVLSHVGETVCWTQSMEIEEGRIVFEIIDGTSTTWGDFGGQGYLKGSLVTFLTNLNDYDPAVSIANSGISYADNRVQSLTLKSVRVYLSTGEEIVQDTPTVVFAGD